MKQPSLYIPHGGGPCFFMDPANPDHLHSDPMWHPMQDYLAGLIATLPERPRAVLLVSGHWETPAFTVHSGEKPSLFYDYYGFPQHTYQLRWDAPGAPELAAKVAGLLREAGMPVCEERERGWDHGVFIPMKVALPDADIPVIQLSLRQDMDPAAHVAAGRALEPLRDEGVLIVGSGMSFHNMNVRGLQDTSPAIRWDDALSDAVTDPDPARRAARVTAWDELPQARFAHPREEHLLPLMIALGAGGEDAARVDHRSTVLGWPISAYRFG